MLPSTTTAINQLLDGLVAAPTVDDVLARVVRVMADCWTHSEPSATTRQAEAEDAARSGRTVEEVLVGTRPVGWIAWEAGVIDEVERPVLDSMLGIASMACHQRIEAVRQRVHASEIAAMHQVMEGVAAARSAEEIARSSLPVIVDTFGWQGGMFLRPDPSAAPTRTQLLARHGIDLPVEVVEQLVATGAGLRGRLLGEELSDGLVHALVWPIHRSTDTSLVLFVREATGFHDGPGETLAPIAQIASVVRAGLERVEQEHLQRQAVEADRANRAKSEFLSRMSHELRTPLNAVLGFAQLLELDGLPPEASESVEQIRKAGEHLLDLVNEVLDIARIEAGRMSLSLEPLDLSEVVLESVGLVQSLADRGSIELVVDTRSLEHRWVMADRQRTKQVLLNLLSNGVKYNRVGGEVRIWAEVAGDGQLLVAVRDTGHGLAREQVERLFTPFERLDAEDRGLPGTGLGLSLSQRLAEVMGGSLVAESEVGHGTTLWLGLPAASSESGVPDEPSAVAGTADEEPSAVGCILYVEDNKPNRRLVAQILRRRPGVTMLDATNAADGLAIARSSIPDLVLLDLDLPDGDGHQVLRGLREDPVTADLPVVIVSADANRANVRSLLAGGAEDYLTKPFDINKLLAVVDHHLALDSSHVAEAPVQDQHGVDLAGTVDLPEEARA